MAGMIEEHDYTTDFTNLTQNEMAQVYGKLAVIEHFDDVNDIPSKILSTIESIYDENFLQISSDELQHNSVLINIRFVNLITEMKTKHNYKNVGILYIEFCDYFDLDYEKTFKVLHDKLQSIIKICCRSMVNPGFYKKLEMEKNGGVVIPSLFNYMTKK